MIQISPNTYEAPGCQQARVNDTESWCPQYEATSGVTGDLPFNSMTGSALNTYRESLADPKGSVALESIQALLLPAHS
jgi:hypothetical protein